MIIQGGYLTVAVSISPEAVNPTKGAHNKLKQNCKFER